MITIDREFRIWAYTVSHGSLLLRSPITYPDINYVPGPGDFNIDIEFSAVSYLELPESMHGISLREDSNNVPERLLRHLDDGLRVFEIRSQGESYYVVAANYLIGKNQWDSNTRLDDFFLEHDEIIALSSNSMSD